MWYDFSWFLPRKRWGCSNLQPLLNLMDLPLNLMCPFQRLNYRYVLSFYSMMFILEFKLFSPMCGNTTIYLLSSSVLFLLHPQSRHRLSAVQTVRLPRNKAAAFYPYVLNHFWLTATVTAYASVEQGGKTHSAYCLKHSRELWLSLITQVHKKSTYIKSVFTTKTNKMAHLQAGGPGDTRLALEAGQQSLLTGWSWVLCKEG